MCFPKVRVRDIGHAPPEIRVRQVIFPIAQIFLIKRGEFGRHPRLGVHAVGDAGDGNLVHRHSRPDIFPNRSTHVAVQFAHTVRVPADPQRQDRHAERVLRIYARLTQAKKFVERKLQLRGEIAEIALHHLPRKSVIARRHRRVRREDISRGDHLQGGIEIESFLRHVQPDALEREEGRVAFVHVKDLRFNPEGGECFYGRAEPSTISWRMRISRSPP